MESSEFSDPWLTMTLPVLLTEDQIFSPSFNPPSSREEVGACAEGVDCYLFVDDWVEPDEEPDDRPDDEAELETTPSLIAMQVHLDAIGDLVSLQPGPMPEVTETPDDPLCVPHSVATWQNEGINQTEQQQHDMHHHREGGPAGSVTRGQGSQRRRRKLAKPVTTPLEDLRVPRSQVLEFAKLKSNLLFPVILPKCAGRDVWPTDMSCSMYPEPQIMYPVCQAPIEYPQPMQQFSPPSPAPNWQARIHEYPQPIPPSPVPAPIWQAPIEYPQPIQQFSPESPVPVPAPMQCYETNILFPAMSPMYAGMYYVEPYVPLTATAMDFVPFTTLPRPQPTFAPTTNAPAEFSTNVTTARIVNMMNTDVETLTGGVDMLSRIEIFHNPQVEITNPGPPTTIYDPSLPIMTAPADPEVSFTPQTQGYSAGAYEGSGLECQFNRSVTWSNRGSPIDWPDAIDRNPEMPPPQLEELPSSYLETILNPYMEYLLADSPNRVVPEQVHELVLGQSQPQYFVEDQYEHIPPPQLQTQGSHFVEQYDQIIPPPTKPSFSPMELGKQQPPQTKQQQEGTTSEGSVPVNAPVSAPVISEFKVPVKQRSRMKWTWELHEKFLAALRSLGGPTSKSSFTPNSALPSYATPKKIRHHMRTEGKCGPGVTIYHVKSHLQKYRNNPNCFDYLIPPSKGAQPPSLRRTRRRRNIPSGSNAPASCEQTAREVADQTDIAEATLAMQQKIQVMQQVVDVVGERWKVLVEQTDAMDKLQGEHLQQMAVVQQMVVDQREAMGSMGEAPDFATILADQMAHVGRNL